jgi:hypothetical protein
MKLIKYRDAGMSTYTYFWSGTGSKVVSPYFDSEKEATDWMDLKKYQAEAQSLWSDSCTSERTTPLDDPKRIEFEAKRNYQYQNEENK